MQEECLGALLASAHKMSVAIAIYDNQKCLQILPKIYHLSNFCDLLSSTQSYCLRPWSLLLRYSFFYLNWVSWLFCQF
jgi:hypothetical protein